MAKLTTLSSWKNLQAHFNTIEHAQMRDLFKKDEKRFEKFSLEFNNILVDYSKNRITEEIDAQGAILEKLQEQKQEAFDELKLAILKSMYLLPKN